MNDKENLALSDEELGLIVKALGEYYDHALNRAVRYKGETRPKKIDKSLAFIQETFQYCTLMYNIRTGKLNPMLTEAMSNDIQATNSPVRDELAGESGEEKTLA